jgi:hypothetical protein
VRPNKKKLLGLDHGAIMDSELTSEFGTGARIDIVETFYDQSIPARYRLYPDIPDPKPI